MDEYVLLTLSLVNSDTRLRAAGISPNIDLTLLTRDFELGVPREDHRFNILRDRGRSTSELKVELFVGGKEYKDGHFKLKDMKSGEEQLIPIDKLQTFRYTREA